MKSIFDIIDKSEINVKIILFHNTIILFIIYLYQISLYFRNETKRFIQVFRKLHRKKKKKKETIEKIRINYALINSKNDNVY